MMNAQAFELAVDAKLLDQAVPAVESLDLVEPYSTPVVINAALMQYTESIIGILAFMFGILHQSQLATGSDYLVWIIVIAAVGLALTHVSEYLNRPNVQGKLWLVKLTAKNLLIVGAYVTGLLARIAADWLFNVPSRGPFGLNSLVMPAFFIAFIMTLLYRDQMTSSLPVDVIKSLDTQIKSAGTAVSAAVAPAPAAAPPANATPALVTSFIF